MWPQAWYNNPDKCLNAMGPCGDATVVLCAHCHAKVCVANPSTPVRPLDGFDTDRFKESFDFEKRLNEMTDRIRTANPFAEMMIAEMMIAEMMKKKKQYNLRLLPPPPGDTK